MNQPKHAFASSFTMAQNDGVLRSTLVKRLGTNQLSPPDASEFVSATCDVVDWVVGFARDMYASHPERLCAAISKSPQVNALAVWASKDWIIVSEGLMEKVQAAADDMADGFSQAFPELLDSELGRNLQATTPLCHGFRSTFASLLYFGCIAFFSGHEAGHHIAGHDGFYSLGFHAELEDEDTSGAFAGAVDAGASSLHRHALESQADDIGLTLCRMTVGHLLLRLCEARDYPIGERPEYSRVLAVLVSACSLMAAIVFKPREIDWTYVHGKATHPPAVYRVVNLANQLTAALKRGMPLLDETVLRWIRVKSLDVAVGATITPKSKEHEILQERQARGGEPAAIRATGIRKAINDPLFAEYARSLARALDEVKPKLRPRTRS